MKEITRVHLAKTPYSIELDAKKDLEKYLHDIERVMKAEPEAVQEIEARLTELLAERGVAKDGVISTGDVAALREKMGEPREFSEDGTDESVEVESTDQRPTRRLMRDRDNAVLGGVGSGIAAYFNIDVLLVRLIMVALLVVSAGTFVFIYIVFWIIMPVARTAADKLTMAGKPVTLEALKESSQEVSQDHGPSGLARFVRGALGVLVFLAMLATLVGVIVGGYLGYDAAAWMTGFSAQPWVFGVLIALFTGGIALVALLGLAAYAAFTWQIRRPVGVAMLAMILVGTMAVTAVAISGVQVRSTLYSDTKRLEKTEEIALPAEAQDIKTVSSPDGIVIYYGKEDGPVRAELSYWDMAKEKPRVEAKVVDGTLEFSLINPADNNCPALISVLNGCSGTITYITVHGIKQPVFEPAQDQLLDVGSDSYDMQ